MCEYVSMHMIRNNTSRINLKTLVVYNKPIDKAYILRKYKQTCQRKLKCGASRINRSEIPHELNKLYCTPRLYSYAQFKRLQMSKTKNLNQTGVEPASI